MKYLILVSLLILAGCSPGPSKEQLQAREKAYEFCMKNGDNGPENDWGDCRHKALSLTQ